MGYEDDDDREFGVSRKIMLAAIFTLFAAVLLIIFFFLYSRYLMTRRQERMRRAAFNQLSRQIAPDVEAAAVAANYSREPPKTGLDPLVIASFPTYPYKAINERQVDNGESRETECSVCLSTIVEEATVRVLPNCKHMFHAECIDMWLGSNTTCPICRTVAEPRVQPEKKEVQPSAPPLETEKGPSGSSGSRFGSFRWMVTSRERPSRTQSCGDEIGALDLERQ